MPEERREQVTRVVIEQSQRLTGGTRRSRWKAAAFNGWHEPDKSRGLCPESVSGSGCKPPGRLGLGVRFPGATHPGVPNTHFVDFMRQRYQQAYLDRGTKYSQLARHHRDRCR